MYPTLTFPKSVTRHRVQPTRPIRFIEPRRQQHVNISPVTGPFDQFANCENILVIADIENWAYGARDLGFEIDFAELARLIRTKLRRAALHAFFSADDHDTVVADRLVECGWEPHPRAIIQRYAPNGTNRSANADLAVAFGVAKLLGHKRVDALLLGTGDGVLALDCARAIRSNFKKCATIGTMSLAGSTSRLLDARGAREIDANLEIGTDAMRPLVR